MLLTNAKKYLEIIALPNCKDFIEYIENNRNMQKIEERFRKFINAVESLNNVIDYMVHDPVENPKKFSEKKDLINELDNRYPGFKQWHNKIEDLANAYKHCVRGGVRKGRFVKNLKKPHANDIIQTNSFFVARSSVGKPLVEPIYSLKDIDDEVYIRSAIEFWQQYIT